MRQGSTTFQWLLLAAPCHPKGYHFALPSFRKGAPPVAGDLWLTRPTSLPAARHPTSSCHRRALLSTFLKHTLINFSPVCEYLAFGLRHPTTNHLQVSAHSRFDGTSHSKCPLQSWQRPMRRSSSPMTVLRSRCETIPNCARTAHPALRCAEAAKRTPRARKSWGN